MHWVSNLKYARQTLYFWAMSSKLFTWALGNVPVSWAVDVNFIGRKSRGKQKQNKEWMGLFRYSAEGTSLLCLLKLTLSWDSAIVYLSRFFERSHRFSVVARNLTISGSILVWSVDHSVPAQSKPMFSCKFYLKDLKLSLPINSRLSRFKGEEGHFAFVNLCPVFG